MSLQVGVQQTTTMHAPVQHAVTCSIISPAQHDQGTLFNSIVSVNSGSGLPQSVEQVGHGIILLKGYCKFVADKAVTGHLTITGMGFALTRQNSLTLHP